MSEMRKFTVVGPMPQGEMVHVHLKGCADLRNLRTYRNMAAVDKHTVEAAGPIEAAFAAILDTELGYTAEDVKVFPCCGKYTVPAEYAKAEPEAAPAPVEAPAPAAVEPDPAPGLGAGTGKLSKRAKAKAEKAPKPEKAPKAPAPAPEPVPGQVTFAISGKAMVGRSWDGGYQVDEKDPYSVTLGAALKAGRIRKMGVGWQKVVTVPVAIAEELATEFADLAEVYQSQEGKEQKVFALAFREAAEFIRAAIAAVK